MPAPGDYDQGLDLGGLAELFNDLTRDTLVPWGL